MFKTGHKQNKTTSWCHSAMTQKCKYHFDQVFVTSHFENFRYNQWRKFRNYDISGWQLPIQPFQWQNFIKMTTFLLQFTDLPWYISQHFHSLESTRVLIALVKYMQITDSYIGTGNGLGSNGTVILIQNAPTRKSNITVWTWWRRR